METLHRLNLASPDLAEEAKAGLREMFPEAFDEQGQLDFARLKELLGELAEGDKSRYGLSWAGKQDAKRTLLSQSVGTLAPMREESVEFDTTENLIIEGDNLEVLKLLQKAYYGKVKMIYIDPPYNTGNDFIYPDNFREGLTDYLKYSGQVSEEGFRTSSNTETSGRYHSNWLNMMYPRLALARNLLREDGVIFVSIDDHEVHNLRMLMDEVFGEENFVAQYIWEARAGKDHTAQHVSVSHEYLICFSKDHNKLQLSKDERVVKEGNYADEKGTYRREQLRQWGTHDTREDRPSMFYPVTAPDGSEVLPLKDDGREGRWRISRSRMQDLIANNDVDFVRVGRRWNLYAKKREGTVTKTAHGTLISGVGTSATGTLELKELCGEKIFSTTKPCGLVRHLMSLLPESEEDLILDFFAGSGTTAQAVMELNQEDGGNRRFILVQLPEPLEPPIKLDDGNELKTIADICRERVRRAAKKIAAKSEGKLDLEESKPDLGFRAFKLTSSNFKLWEDTTEGDTEKLKEQLKLYAENILPDRDPEWVLYEILLKSGIELSAPVESIEVDGEPVFKIAGGRLLAYLNDPVDESALRKLIEMGAEKIVCLDHGFRGNDSLKANIAQQVKQWNSHHPEKPVDFRTV